eukprot:4743792-Amphidinium_carterae.1
MCRSARITCRGNTKRCKRETTWQQNNRTARASWDRGGFLQRESWETKDAFPLGSTSCTILEAGS